MLVKAIILGLGVYKKEVKNSVEKLISITRDNGLDGVAFYGYGDIKNSKISSFSQKATLPKYRNYALNNNKKVVRTKSLIKWAEKGYFLGFLIKHNFTLQGMGFFCFVYKKGTFFPLK